ncbi:MAG: HAMP domain-containing histidine kinase [Lachnospiraceae bacterium]|nr:HAMP domain-containing histidine kinase [Lachnospiraceae bacterium]
MLKKISVRFILLEWVFLVIVIGGSIVLYGVFAPAYYSSYKGGIIQQAFEDIKETDFKNLSEEDIAMFLEYEKENLSFTIADGNMNSIYTTKSNEEHVIYRNIELKLEQYSENPQIINKNSKRSKTLKLLGIVRQDGVPYYVCIRDKVENVYSSFQITEKFMMVMFVIALAIGSLLMYLFSRNLARPIRNVARVAQRLAERDFEEKADENGGYEEVNHLAKCINCMSGQLQDYVEQIEESQKQLLNQNIQKERMEKARKDFIANVSHELKTPLAVISSQAEMLQYVGEKEREYYCLSIMEEVTKMSEMVGNLLDISVMEHYMEEIKKEPLLMNDLISYMLMKYDALMKKKKLTIQTELEENCYILGDREYMEQAISNLLMNAFEHTGQQGNMVISLKKVDEGIRFTVYNDGSRIPEKNLEKIWKSFFRKENEEATLGHAGIGLYIVQSVVHLHGGKYGAENKEHGVEFWFTMPALER